MAMIRRLWQWLTRQSSFKTYACRDRNDVWGHHRRKRILRRSVTWVDREKKR